MKTLGRFFSRHRLRLVLGAAAVVGIGVSTTGRAASRSEILEAIHGVENPRDVSRPGRHGELGAYQFRPATWRMHTAQPFARALERPVSDEVAIAHYEWLRRGLVRNGCAPTAYNIALAWNGGLSAAVKGRAPAAARDYAERVDNLVEAHRSGRLARAD